MKQVWMPALVSLVAAWLPSVSAPLLGQEGQLDLKSRSLVAMPLVNTNPAMKTSFGGIGMLLFRPNGRDTVSPPSVIGAAGLYSTNNSYVFAVPVRLFLHEDRWRLMAVGGTARVNNDFTYDLDSASIQLVYSEGRTFMGAEVQARLVGQLYGGLAYNGIWTTYRSTGSSGGCSSSTAERLGWPACHD